MTDFQRLIAEWYRLNKRDLPWRNTDDPYFIWLSEIILQQTRVAQGLNYYLKFIEHYPTVRDLANASEQEVLNDWQGLGYYSRARNLHSTAKIISSEFGGDFPNTYDQIIKLKGVGEYTAAAIASFGFDLPFSVVDGNVYRVLSRVFNIDLPIDSTEGKKYFAKLAQELLSYENPAIHNQAIMELGAVQCLPSNPNCGSCPLNVKCLSLSEGVINERPVKAKKTKVRNRYFNYMIFSDGNKTILEQRKGKDIWQHLYQFPMIETESEKNIKEMNEIFEEKLGVQPIDFSEQQLHILSHQKIYAQFYVFNTFPKEISKDFIEINQDQIQDFPLPRLIDRYLESFVF
jgi:A/G-specific adenine glycosylase